MEMGEKENEPEYLHLSQVPLFRSLPAEELDILLKSYKTWDAPAGTLILQEGQPADEFYVILRGRVEIVRALGHREQSVIGRRLPGEFIGEVGLLHQGAARTASARVVEDARLLVITYANFNKLLKIHPELAYEIASVLSARLTAGLNRHLGELRDKNEKLQQAYDELKTAQAQIIEKEKLEQSLQVARKIQYSILPTTIPQMEGYDIGALMMPAQVVGGDFYGVYALDEGHMALIVGDVSDKGIAAALFMAQSHALLRASIENGVSPKVVLERVNNLLLEMNAEGLYVTVIYGILDKPSGEFRYTRAGHELPLVFSSNNNVSFPEQGKGRSLGLFEHPILEERRLTIPPGGGMLLYSDGATDIWNTDEIHFGKEGLMQAVKLFGIHIPAQQTCQAIYDFLVEYQNGAPQFDDVTLLVVRRLP
jgi:serine phosphatase RsbU (regulator of sigma subunit)